MRAEVSPPSQRIASIDIAKGIAAVLMVLGHAEIFLNPKAYFPLATQDGKYLPIEDLYNFGLYVFQSSVDAFYFFAGLGLAVALSRSAEVKDLRLKLCKRGLVLILIDLTVISWSYGYSPWSFRPLFGSIATFGVCFILLSLLLSWRTRWLLLAALLILGLRELLLIREPYVLDSVWGTLYGVFWAPVQAEHWSSTFTVLSWLPIIMLGYGFGRKMRDYPALLSAKSCLGGALALLLLFVVARVVSPVGSLGQPLPRSLLQVLQLDKYPASIHFHLLNLSFVGFYLYIGTKVQSMVKGAFARDSLTLFGNHIFFVYIAHLLIFAVFKFAQVFAVFENKDLASLAGFVLCLAVLLPLTRWFDRFKRRFRQRWWLLNYI